MSNLHSPEADSLFEAILSLKTQEECYSFFEDLCTIGELQAMIQRFQVAGLLHQGLVYSEVGRQSGASSATISRVRRSMLDNGAGGVMEHVIQREGLHEPKEAEPEQSE